MTKLVVIQDAIPSDDFRHGGQVTNQLVLLLTGEPLDTEEDIRINTTFKFYSGKLALFDDDPLLTHKLVFKLENIASGAVNKSITYRSPTVDDDFAVTEWQNQVLHNKVLSTNTQVTANLTFSNSAALMGAIINAASNTLTNIPNTALIQITDKGKLHSLTAFEDKANVFTVAQKISLNAEPALTLYRPAVGFAEVGLNFSGNNAAATEKIYGYVRVALSDRTVDSEDGYMSFGLMQNGTLQTKMISYFNGNLAIGNAFKTQFDVSQIATVDKVITIPNITGNMLTNNSIDNVTAKELDTRKNTFLRMARVGRYHCSSESGVDAEGVLQGLVSVGDQGTTTVNTGGKYHIWNTKAVINDCAGVLKIGGFVTQRLLNPLVRFAFLFVPSATRRVFKGWTAQRLLSVDSDTVPLLNTEHGFIFGYGVGDTQWQIWHNDGTGVCVKETALSAGGVGMNLPGVATNLILEISNSGATYTWSLYAVDGTTQARGTLLGTGTINTRIPGNTTNLCLQDLVATSSAAIQANNIHYIEVYN